MLFSEAIILTMSSAYFKVRFVNIENLYMALSAGKYPFLFLDLKKIGG